MFLNQDFKCNNCGRYYTVLTIRVSIGQPIVLDEPCSCGHTIAQRCILSINTNGTHPRTRFQPHLNNSTGTRVSSMTDFRDDLKRKSEAASEYTGITHDFQPVDRDAAPDVGINDHGADDGARRDRELHRTEPTTSHWI